METSIRARASRRLCMAQFHCGAGSGLRAVACAVAAAVMWLSIPTSAAAQVLSEPVMSDTLYASESGLASATVRRWPALRKERSEATATIIFRYEGNVPAEARAAFDFAGGIWESHLQSTVPIHVLVKWEDLGEDVLGTAGPRLVANWRSNMKNPDTWYPTAIAEAMQNQDFTGEDDEGNPVPDIESTFNSGFTRWHFGLDENVPSDQYDFVSVVVHELGHGLGFTGSFDIEDGDGDESSQDCPNTDTAGVGCWGLPTNDGRLFPFIFDRFTEDASQVSLLNTSTYPNPSTQIASVLQSEQISFDGTASRSINHDVPVTLFAPTTFEAGSSYSHLDEGAFPRGTPNALMTPEFSNGEISRSPGPVTCGIMQDLGWTLGQDCMLLVGMDPLEPGVLFTLDGFGPNPFSDRAEATLVVDSQQVVRAEVYDVTGRLLATVLNEQVPAQQPVRIILDAVSSWSSGVYFVRVTGETFTETQSVVFVR